LKTETTCLTCHAEQGYKVGDVRGGLTVSFPYLPFQKATNAARLRIYSFHVLFFIIATAIVFTLGKKLIKRIEELQKALRHIKTLEGLLPICAHCKSIRKEGGDPKDQEAWVPVEVYIQNRTDAEFSHGICPACMKQHFQVEFEK